MASAYWRIRRLWAIERRLFEDSLARQDEKTDDLGRLAAAFSSLAATPDLALIHRYETRLHRIYQRGLHNLLLLRLNQPPAALPEPQNKPCQTNLVPFPDTPPQDLP
jgi:hypothetical protein